MPDTESIVLTKLNIPEKLLLGYFAYLTAGVFFFSLDGRQRLTVVVLNCLIAGVILLAGHYGQRCQSAFLAALRPWIPVFFILVAYRESGLFFTPDPSHRLDYLFIRVDNVILRSTWVQHMLGWGAPWLQYYLELSYLLCYPVVPLGLISLYLVRFQGGADNGPLNALDSAEGRSVRMGHAMEHFWTAVVLASCTCYLLFPLFPLAPPRELFDDVPGPRVAPLLRGLNYWILGKYSVGASLFPSAHVASTTAQALAIRRYLPRLGWFFVVVAVSIALATVYGRYHYALDAVAGGFVGVSAYWVSCRAMRRRYVVKGPQAVARTPEPNMQK